MAAFRYTHAVVSRIPVSLRTRGQIDLEEAKKEHENYVRLLRELGLDVIELPPDEALPECVFVEDCAVICNGTALITRPGASHRQKEVETIRVVLKKELDLPIIEMPDPNGRLDGGDVLFTVLEEGERHFHRHGVELDSGDEEEMDSVELTPPPRRQNWNMAPPQRPFNPCFPVDQNNEAQAVEPQQRQWSLPIQSNIVPTTTLDPEGLCNLDGNRNNPDESPENAGEPM